MVVSFQRSEEYEKLPTASQRKVAHAACEAGEDMVIGIIQHSVPRVVRGSFVACSLRNFVFHRMFSHNTR